MLKSIKRAALWLLIAVSLLAALAWLYYRSLDLESIARPDPATTVAAIDYLKRPAPAARGRILAVVSSTERMAGGRKKAGYELTELARAYYVFQANGYAVDIASPAGGKPPVRIDTDDMGAIDYAFLNDPEAQARVAASLPLAGIDPSRYAAVFFVGGKGAMIDFPGHPDIARIVRQIAPRGVVGAVCHGPAALPGILGEDGKPLFAGRRMTGFSNAEELFLMKDARSIYPFLLEDEIRRVGARFSEGPLYLDHTVADGRLVTGQNAWSTWSTAEAMIRALGHTPVARRATAEESSVRLLDAYYRRGYQAARAEQAQVERFDKMLLLMHAVVAGMEWRLVDAFHLQRLATQ